MEEYFATCSLIHGEIYKILEKKEDENSRFAPRLTIKHLFQRDNHALLRRLFRSLAPSGEVHCRHRTVSEDLFVSLVESRKLSNFWGALVFATCSIEAAMTALNHLIAVDKWPIIDMEEKHSFLPLTRAELNDILGSTVDADRFFSKQACFCPVVLRNREEVIVKDPSCQRLPYLEEEFLGEGAFGKVYRVKVAKDHFYDGHAEAAKAYNGRPQDMARKDYIIADVSRAREEYNIMKKILNANFHNRTSNIVQSLGCLQIGHNYSLFMPVAICDLHTYMMVQHPNARQELHNRAEIVLSAAGLASGLHFLHSGIRTASEELVCYHMDLNPSNVLVFVERGRHVWKLSDFGMARVKTRTGQVGYTENDFNSLFVRRKKVQDPSLPATLNRRGEGTYLPPESIAAEPTMKTGGDVWALGCVLSVVFAYIGGGAAGVHAYADARGRHRRADEHDRFFIRGMQFSSPKVHPEIRHWHEKLSTEAMHRNVGEGNAFSDMLTFLQDKVFKINQTKRCQADAVQSELERTYRMLKAAEGERRASAVEKVTMSFVQQQKRKLMSSNKRPALAKMVSQRLASTDDFKGLVFSPDASCLAYWTDRKIVLYTSQSLSFTEDHASSPPSQWPLEETDCFLKSICLTTKYLVACTIGQNSLYIFYLVDDSHADPNFSNMRRIALDAPAISNIAMSPNSETLVFIMRNDSDIRGPATLVYVSVQDLDAFIRNELSDSQSADSIRISKSHKILQHSMRLDWPADDIIHLSVSDTKDAYTVVRPELTAKSREHKIPIAHIWTDPSSNGTVIDTLNIVSLGFDGSSTAGFFTTFCIVGDRHSCALVTRGKRFHLQRFDDDRAGGGDQRDIRHYRIVKLFNTRPSGRHFAIGNVAAKQQMLLLEVEMSSALTIRELVKIPGVFTGDDVTAVAADHGDKVRVIVASLTGASCRVIFRVSVPKYTANQR